MWYVRIGCLIYTDDILLSASVVHLQKKNRFDKGSDIDIIFNVRKSSLFIIGKLYDNNIDGICADVVSWNQNLKYAYLGLSFKSGRLQTNRHSGREDG